MRARTNDADRSRAFRCSSLAFGVTFALALAGCPQAQPPQDGAIGDASDASDATIDVTPAVPGLVARFNPTADDSPPAPFEVPFPSDLYRAADGTLIDTLDRWSAIHLVRNTAAFAQGFRDLDGFGQSTGAMFLIDGVATQPGDPAPEIDLASIPANGAASLVPTATAFIVDLDPSATPATARVPCAAGWHSRFRTITVQPDRTLLAAGRRYAVVLTTGVRATSGGFALRPSDAFAAIRDNVGSARNTTIGRLYGDALDRVLALSPAGFDRTTIAALAVFTTQTTQRDLRAARDALESARFGPAPTLITLGSIAAPYSLVRFGSTAHAGWNATLDQWLGTPMRRSGMDVTGIPGSNEPGVGFAHDALGAVFTGTFIAPDFRNATGRIVLGSDGVPTVADATRQIPVTIALPRGPVPAAGFPVVIYAHGLGGQRIDMVGIMNEMARHGIATAAIDWNTFGQRATPMPYDRGSFAAGTYRGPDGFADTTNGSPGDFVGNFVDMIVFRDNLRQSALEIVQLRRLLANPALDLSYVADEYGGTAPRLDGQHIAYIGGSLGGIIGTIIAGIEPAINPFVLNVAGGAFATQIVPSAPNQAATVQALLPTLLGVPNEPVDRFHPVGNILQMILDAGDAIVYARDATHPATGRGHDVWLIEALWDETVGNTGTEFLATQLGIPQLQPAALRVDALPLETMTTGVSGNLPNGVTGGFYQLVPAAHYTDLVSRESNALRYIPPFPRDTEPRFPMVAAPYSVREWVVPLQQHVATFLTSAFAGAARIEVTGIEPWMDQDDDGWMDDEETTQGTDAFDPTSHPAGMPPHTRNVGY